VRKFLIGFVLGVALATAINVGAYCMTSSLSSPAMQAFPATPDTNRRHIIEVDKRLAELCSKLENHLKYDHLK
jgi:cytochrome c-type biogenesis protein CcmH/NrfG